MDTMLAVRGVHCAQSVLDYVLDVADATRAHPGVVLGASPRASLGLLNAARAHATVMRRDFVSPDDVKAVASAALGHRIMLSSGVDPALGGRIVAEITGTVATPIP
jgi:MoxR-like ATPase